jgi:hypothetical protein
MPNWVRILIAVLVIVSLIVIFVVSFILYRRTPLPKGCEDLEPSEEKCAACKDEHCHLNIYANKSKKEKKQK